MIYATEQLNDVAVLQWIIDMIVRDIIFYVIITVATVHFSTGIIPTMNAIEAILNRYHDKWI